MSIEREIRLINANLTNLEHKLIAIDKILDDPTAS